MQNTFSIRKLLMTVGVVLLDFVLLSGFIFWQDLNDSFQSVGAFAIPIYWIIAVVINTFITLWLVRLWHPVFASKVWQAIILLSAALLALVWTTWLVFVVPFYLSEKWKPIYNVYAEKENLASLARLKQSYQEPTYFPPSLTFTGKEQSQQSWKSGYSRLITSYVCKESPRQWLSLRFYPSSYKPNTSVYRDAERLEISDKKAVFYTAVFDVQASFLVIYDKNATIELSEGCGMSKDEFLKVAASLRPAEFTGQAYSGYGF